MQDLNLCLVLSHSWVYNYQMPKKLVILEHKSQFSIRYYIYAMNKIGQIQ